MPLTATQIKQAKPKDKTYTLNDGHGLSLAIQPKGSKLWRYRKTIDGKPILRSLGSYPEISLADARDRAAAYAKSLAQGIDPMKEEKRALAKAENTFEVVAREWLEKQRSNWREGYGEKIIARFETYVFKFIGDKPIEEIKAPDILKPLRAIEDKAAYSAHRCRADIGRVFRYAIATGRADRNPAEDLKGALRAHVTEHHASFTDPKDIAALLRAIDGYHGTYVVQCAFRLTPLLFVRPAELRQMEWAEIDFDAKEWRIPASKMKKRREHIVPLPDQALAILEEIKPLTGQGKYVFPSVRSSARPMSSGTVRSALLALGYDTKEQQSAHGFRSMASTLLNEMGWKSDVIERQLAHVEENKVRGAYNKAEYIEDRRKMMQAWADYLDSLKDGAKIIPIGIASNEL